MKPWFELAHLGLREVKEVGNLVSHEAEGYSALHFASYYNRPQATKLLLEAKANVNERCGNLELTPLWFATLPEIITLLLNANADPTIVNKYGTTPLHKIECLPCLEVYLQHGAPIDIKNQSGWTPIHSMSASMSFSEVGAMVRLLNSRGYNLEIESDDGWTSGQLIRTREPHYNVPLNFPQRTIPEELKSLPKIKKLCAIAWDPTNSYDDLLVSPAQRFINILVSALEEHDGTLPESAPDFLLNLCLEKSDATCFFNEDLCESFFSIVCQLPLHTKLAVIIIVTICNVSVGWVRNILHI